MGWGVIKIIASLMFASALVSGCSKLENDAKEAVLSSLKDPESAQFKNIKGYCGEVNSKNSYGGYVGFKKFVSVKGATVLEGAEGVDPLTFTLIWEAHCTPNKLSIEERSECVKDAYNQAIVMDGRLKGVSKESIRVGLLANKTASKAEVTEALRDLNRAYESNLKDKDAYALDVVTRCVKSGINN